MKFTERVRRHKRGHIVVTAGVLAAGLATSMMAPAFAQEAAPGAEAQAPLYTEQPLAERGDNALDATLAPQYRIPALADLGGGVVLASYDGRPNGGDSPAPNSIIQRRSTDGGVTWGKPTFISRGQIGSGDTLQYGFSDPSYVVDKETGTVFNFHVYSKNQGFFGSVLGSDDSNRNVTGTEVSISTDKGLTWSTDPSNIPTLPVPQSHPADSQYAEFDGPLVTDVVKPLGETVNGVANVGGVVGMFASSGEGIQLKYGADKGRLIQQFAGRVLNAAGAEVIQAYSVYSDDHGKTWVKGGNVGATMDENKVVELSNGDVMLNSRDNVRKGGRHVVISKDGGESWGAVRYDKNLTDPGNNASIARMYPDAPEDSAEAKILLFSNANSASGRSNGSIRYSCDDGNTWSAGTQFKNGYMAYSTVTALSDGSFGLLYESDQENIYFAKFNAEWLNVFCGAEVSVAALSGANGATVDAAVTVRNVGAEPLAGTVASFQSQAGWTFGSVDVPDVAPGQSTVVTVPVTIPTYAKAGTFALTATVSHNGKAALGAAPITITGGATTNIAGLSIKGSISDTGRDLAINPYAAGEAVPYLFRVDSLSNITIAATPISGNFNPFLPPSPGNCRYRELLVWGGYNCTTPKHTVTDPELEQGFFVPVTAWQASGTGATSVDYTIVGDEVDLIVRNPELTATAASVWNDLDGNGLASAGDAVTTTATAANTGNVALTAVAGLGTEHGTLAVGESASFTETRELTTAELTSGAVAERTVALAAFNGAKDASTAVPVDSLALPIEQEAPAFEPSVERAPLKGQAPVDLGLKAGKYSVGDAVAVKNLPADQWAYVHLNQHGTRIGWFLANAEGTVEFTVPEDTKNGKDTLVVSDGNGELFSFGAFHVTPGAK